MGSSIEDYRAANLDLKVPMIPSIPRVYVHTRQELSDIMRNAESQGQYPYRTTLWCECNEKNYRTKACVILDNTGKLSDYVIRCRSCATNFGKEDKNGNI